MVWCRRDTIYSKFPACSPLQMNRNLQLSTYRTYLPLCHHVRAYFVSRNTFLTWHLIEKKTCPTTWEHLQVVPHHTTHRKSRYAQNGQAMLRENFYPFQTIVMFTGLVGGFPINLTKNTHHTLLPYRIPVLYCAAHL